MRTGPIGMHMHGGGGSGSVVADLVLLAPFALALLLYGIAVAISRRRGRPWPWYRTALWGSGMVTAAVAVTMPAVGGFAAHMAVHLVLGMIAPLLLVLAAPVTLALRTLSVVPARRLSRMLNSPPARILTHPVVASVVNVGSLWLLYRTPLFPAMLTDPIVHALVMAHFLVAGYLFTASLVSVDPAPHRASFTLRAAVLVASIAAHGILAKSLVASPPFGVAAAEVEGGARLMFTGGDAVEVVIAVLLCAQAYRAAGRRFESGATVSAPATRVRNRIVRTPAKRWSPS